MNVVYCPLKDKMSFSYFVASLLAAVLFFGLVIFIFCGVPKKNIPVDKITAFGMGWYPIVSKPVPVIYTDPPSVHDNINLMQVEISIGGPPAATAFINAEQLAGKITPLTNIWSKGDEVLVVNVPGRNFAGFAPAYFVVDYRPASKAEASSSK
jgi:hypothetical protein